MGDSNVNLATLIGSRICHDLISPIGAISNGLELLGMADGVQGSAQGGARGPEMDLITDSVGNAGARIRFFRIAYGPAGDQMMGPAEIISVLNDLGQGGRHQVQWGPLDAQPRPEVRLVFLALQCFETAMPYGGTVHVAVEGGTWIITANADKLAVDQALWAELGRSGDVSAQITPALVQFALFPAVATDLGRTPQVTVAGNCLSLRF